ncbi:hypothetical protein ADIARSV_0391 [Arcticibacter svalbardensis MN12-7]|uniref:Uncharacterized protein n=1 Tax=Arcticibacter svalbardensis MN12-7 TaxID=1150600 RepID=R9GXU1_9SPHI|nr:hypothetical protein ADIARSV_0391 [Arcticibacter svalbardensis MN12-7]
MISNFVIKIDLPFIKKNHHIGVLFKWTFFQIYRSLIDFSI